MNAIELEDVKRQLKRLLNKKKFEGKKICLFGVSDNTRQIIEILRVNGYEPRYVTDNDKNKQGGYCLNVEVVPIREIPARKDIVWLLYSFFYMEMKAQLLSCGFHNKQIISLWPKEPTLLGSMRNAYKGKHFYDNLTLKYGKVPFFLCPYTGTGDIYLIGTFWKEYIKTNNIDNYVFIVISGACKKVANLFDIKNIVLLENQKDAERLICYYNLCPESGKIKILNDAWAKVYSNTSEWFRGYKKLYFTELFRKWVFNLPEDVTPEHPYLKDASKEIEKLFEENGLKKGKTVVLSPYSNTLSELPNTVWEEISNGLKSKEYAVCTNCSGKNELPIKGTRSIFFSLDIAPQFVNYAGGFIGIRSGLCDIISNCDAKKIIFYDSRNRFYNCSAYDYFNLKSMGLCNDAIEIQYDNDELEKIVQQVLREF